LNSGKTTSSTRTSEPETAKAYNERGAEQGNKGNFHGAIADHTKAIEMDPLYASAYNSLAWLWATCPQETYRDGKRALEYARKANELTYWEEPNYMDTLAAANAEAGNFDEAIKWQNKALSFPLFANNEGIDARARLQLYTERKPYREPYTSQGYFNRGGERRNKGEFYGAIADFTKAIKLDPLYANAYNNLAWLWATCPQETYRDGKRALEYARKAAELTNWQVPEYLDTLAAANAEAGNFDEAIKWQNKALSFPLFAMNEGEGARHRLQVYTERKPYRQP
jgi:tetratricopeptide (TPR) repeat protein